MAWMERLATLALAAGLLLGGSALQAQGKVGPEGGIVALSGGQTLVVAPRPKALTAEAPLARPSAPAFRRLPLTVITEVQTVVGQAPAPATMTGTPAEVAPFTLNARAGYVEGRGYLAAAGINYRPDDGSLELYDANSVVAIAVLNPRSTRVFMVHLQVLDLSNSATDYTLKFADGSSMSVPAKPNKQQDILVVVSLPKGVPVPTHTGLVWLRRAGTAGARLLGVEVTPM